MSDDKVTSEDAEPKSRASQESDEQGDATQSPDTESESLEEAARLSAGQWSSYEEGESHPRKKKPSLFKMASLAALLFFAVLFLYLTQEPTPPTTLPLSLPEEETVQGNASSPYGLRVEQLREMEELLDQLNLDPGLVDGKVDNDTVAAISLFQEISGLEVDGTPSRQLLEELKAVHELMSEE